MQKPVIIVQLCAGESRYLPEVLVARLEDAAHQLDMGLPHLIEVALTTWLNASDAQVGQ